jgi:hypothetical protein
MTTDDLARLVQEPAVRGQLLQGYRGPYLLGITNLPGAPYTLAIALRVPDPGSMTFPSEIELDGERVPVVLDRFVTPSAFYR